LKKSKKRRFSNLTANGRFFSKSEFAPTNQRKVQENNFNLQFNSIVFVNVRQVNLEEIKSKIVKYDLIRMETQEIKSILGRNIKYFRFHKQLSQSELAEKADISITFLSNIERGKMFPKVETLSRITKSLNVSVFELFRDDLIPKNDKEMMNRLSEDMTKNVNLAMAEVFKQYMK